MKWTVKKEESIVWRKGIKQKLETKMANNGKQWTRNWEIQRHPMYYNYSKYWDTLTYYHDYLNI